ncbi:MAG TPA: hypothetical protein VKY40_05065, partial [Halanaerobiales bacterium]|nr:hypothetical protein [Halanaerobiales bacterium]
EQMEGLIQEEKADQALEFFFSELDYIILHRSFNSYTLNKYKKIFKKAEEVEIPSWLELNLDDLDTTLEQLELIEVIDYLMLSTIIIASSTGASSTGAGAPGSGAGGGGGGAA